MSCLLPKISSGLLRLLSREGGPGGGAAAGRLQVQAAVSAMEAVEVQRARGNVDLVAVGLVTGAVLIVTKGLEVIHA